MIKACKIAAAALAAVLLASCVSEAGGSAGSYAGSGLVAYYDGHYGPFQAGYWGMNGYFYYLDTNASRYRRDREHHFRRDPMTGFAAVTAQAEPEERRLPNRPRN